MDYGHVFRDTWKVSLKVTGTCKKGLLLFIIVLPHTNSGEQQKKNKTATVDEDGGKDG